MAAAAVAVSVTSVCAAGLAAGVFAGFQRQAADALFPSDDVDRRLVVVGIDRRSILETATPWPWPRQLQADLVRRLTTAGATMVVLDVLYHPAGPGDAELAASLRASGGAIVASAAELAGTGLVPLLRARVLTEPVARIGAVSSVGHVNITPDAADAVVRTLPLAVEGPDGQIVPSLSLVALGRLTRLGGPVILRRHGVQLGDRYIPTGALGRLEINYAGALRPGSGGAAYRSAADVLGGRLRPGDLAGRVVLLGATDPALGDSQVTPVDKGGRMPGVFIHANALNTLLTRSYLTPASRLDTLAWVLALAFVAALATLALPLWTAFPVALAAVGIHVVIGVARFHGGLVVNFVYPVLAAGAGFVIALGLRYAGEVRARRRMGEVLSQYVPPTVARELLDRGPRRDLPSGTITFLFTDVVGSTAAWESHPREMSRAMRLHDSLIEVAVQAGGGALVRPRGEGDSRFAVFVDPNGAVRAAGEFAASLADERWPTPQPVQVRMALHTGEAELWDGDYYGSPPNRCARLRAVAEPGQILLSSATVAAVDEKQPAGLSLHPLGPVVLKDFDDPEEPHELRVTPEAGWRRRHWEPTTLVEPDGEHRLP